MLITQFINLELSAHLRDTAFPLADANGNCVSFIDDAGNVQAHYVYDAFGGTVSQSGDMDDVFRFRFSSKYLDDETGLYYYGYRWYSSSLGRWMSNDPIGQRGGLLLYGFVGNDGVNIVDKLGLLTLYATPGINGWGAGAYYWFGLGTTLDFSNTKMLPSLIKQAGNDLNRIKKNILGTADIDCSKAYTSPYGDYSKEKKQFINWSGSLNDIINIKPNASWTEAFKNPALLFNGSPVKVNYECTATVLCKCCEGNEFRPDNIEGHCYLSFELNDMFENPLDRGPEAGNVNPAYYSFRSVKHLYKACKESCYSKYGLFSRDRWKCLSDCREKYPRSEEFLATPYKMTASWNESYEFTESLGGCQ